MKQKHIIIINGTGGCGKDTFVGFCSKLKKTLNVSAVDKVKEAAHILVNWNGEKTEEARKMLSDLKRISIEYNNAPTNYILSKSEEFRNSDYELMFVHIREVDEIEKTKKLVGASTLLVTNKNIAPILTNESDKNVENYQYDYKIKNDSTLEDLETLAKEFIENLD